MGGAEGTAGRANDLFAVEGDLAVVVGDDDEMPGGVGGEPVAELGAVGCVVVRVVGVEESDAGDGGGDDGVGVEVAEDERPATAVTREDDLRRGTGKGACGFFENRLDDLAGVGIGLAEGGPGALRRLGDGEDDVVIVVELAESADLGGDMLDVEMPIDARRDGAAEGLLDRVAVGGGVKDEEVGPGGIERGGGVDTESNARVEGMPAVCFGGKGGGLGRRGGGGGGEGEG